jgi:hypothetical protein
MNMHGMQFSGFVENVPVLVIPTRARVIGADSGAYFWSLI